MEKKKQLEFINTLRFLSVVWIVFAHFNYQCFSHYFQENILQDFCYNSASWLYWIFYGITGKYAVAMMCIISGWLVAKKFYQKAADFGKFIFSRYLRLMLPIFVTCTIYVIIRMIQGNFISLARYLNGVLWLGSNSINEHLSYILDFFLGNVLIALLTYLFSEKKYYSLLYIPLMILLCGMNKIWILATVFGGFTYYLCEMIKTKNLYKYWYLLFLIPIIWWLPRGEESKGIYLRDTLACAIIFITVYCLPKLQNSLNWNKIKSVKKISFSLFVTHGLVNNLLSGYIVEYFKNINIIENVYLLQLLTFCIVFVIDLLVAGVIYYLVENKLYHYINGWLEKRVNNYQIILQEETPISFHVTGKEKAKNEK